MASSNRLIFVIDFETNDLAIPTLFPLQLACVAVDPQKLTLVPGSQFDSFIRPADFAQLDDTPNKKKALEINGIAKAALEQAPGADAVVRAFRDHVKKFSRGAMRPYASGKNIRTFDIPILDRLCREAGIADKDGRNPIFDQRVQFDIDDDLERFFRHTGIIPDIRMDTVRDFFGMTKDGAHDARLDVLQEGWLLVKFLRLYRDLAPRIPFAGAARANGGVLV